MALLATLPKRLRLLNASQTPLDDKAATAFTELVVGEVSRAKPELRRELEAPATAFVYRLLTPSKPSQLPAPLLGHLTALLFTHVPSAPARLRDRGAALLAEVLRDDSREDAAAFLKSDQRSLARALSDLPLEARSGRSLFLAALFRVAPDKAREPMWWTRLSYEQLVEAAQGPLSAALKDDVVGRDYVAPVTRNFAEVASTRKALVQVVGAPVELARHVPASLVREIWTRASGNDKVAEGWLDELTSRAELGILRQSLEDARSTADRSSAQLATSHARLQELEAELDRLVEELRHLRQESHIASDAHDRQVKLDVVTALANLALSVIQSPAAREDAALIQAVEYVTGREGLAQIESSGREVPFQPELHDSLGQAIEPGMPVLVLRPGYTYNSPQESIVLIKAQVGKR